MENNETKAQAAPSLVRIAEKKFQSYDEAKAYIFASLSGVQTVDKAKIFRRFDGTYDAVFYAKPVAPKQEPKVEVAVEEKVHGLTAKERRAREKKGA